jgi:hypothetical protein
VSERPLREIYLPAFEAAVKKAHVGSIMDSYNLLNGEHATANYHLTVETFDNDKFAGKPVSTRTEMTSSPGQNMLDNPDMVEMINNITADQMAAFMNMGGPPHFNRWTGYYFARAPGNFLVFVENQGQYRLTIDGQKVIGHAD